MTVSYDTHKEEAIVCFVERSTYSG